MSIRSYRASNPLAEWFRNIATAVVTVAEAMWVTVRSWIRTYDPQRKTFTEHFEYPELPVPVADRYRGFHRYHYTSCGACGRCAMDCPVNCIYIGRERVEGRKGFRVTGFVIDYTKCLLCGLCTVSCPNNCLEMGLTHDLSCYSRDGCIVDFSRLPVDIAWGRDTLNPTIVAYSKLIRDPVGPASDP